MSTIIRIDIEVGDDAGIGEEEGVDPKAHRSVYRELARQALDDFLGDLMMSVVDVDLDDAKVEIVHATVDCDDNHRVERYVTHVRYPVAVKVDGVSDDDDLIRVGARILELWEERESATACDRYEESLRRVTA